MKSIFCSSEFPVEYNDINMPNSSSVWSRPRNTRRKNTTGIIWFYDWGILWLIAFYDCFPNSRSQVPLSILLFDLILWLGWLDFMTIFHQIWGEKGKFLVLNYSCLRQFQLIVLAMLSKISQTGGNVQFQLLILAHANKKQHYLGHILSLEWKIP